MYNLAGLAARRAPRSSLMGLMGGVLPIIWSPMWSPWWSPPVEVCTAVLVDSLLYTAVPVHEYSYIDYRSFYSCKLLVEPASIPDGTHAMVECMGGARAAAVTVAAGQELIATSAHAASTVDGRGAGEGGAGRRRARQQDDERPLRQR